MYDSTKIYVTDGLDGKEDVKIMTKCGDNFSFNDFHDTITFDFENYAEYTPSAKIYILDTMDDLVDFIEGKRDFPTVNDEIKTDESPSIDMDRLDSIIYTAFDNDMQKDYSAAYCNTECENANFDCRKCFRDYLLSEVIK